MLIYFTDPVLSPVQPPPGPGQSHGEPLHPGRGGGGVHGPQDYSLAQSGHRGQFEPSRGQFGPSRGQFEPSIFRPCSQMFTRSKTKQKKEDRRSEK
jgi:hypothetical protein